MTYLPKKKTGMIMSSIGNKELKGKDNQDVWKWKKNLQMKPEIRNSLAMILENNVWRT